MPNLTKANQLYVEAQKKLHGGLLSFFSGSNRYEDASDLFNKAGNLFKSEEDFNGAARSFESSYNCLLKMKSDYYASNAAAEVGACYARMENLTLAETWYNNAINIILDSRINQAAKYTKLIAELFESTDLTKSLKYYEKAEKLFTLDKPESSEARNAKIKIAFILGEMKSYAKARDIYLMVAKSCLNNNLLQFSARDYFLRMIILDFAANDIATAEKDFNFAIKNDPRFINSREFKLCKSLMEAFKENDIKKFEDAVFEFDQIQTLDFWKVKILTQAKQNLKGAEDLDILGGDEKESDDLGIL